MTVATVYKQGWTLDEVHWDWFDPTRVDPVLLAAVKAAALVEYNAPDYVDYLKRVFHDAGSQTLDAIEQWGQEEGQHGKALGRYAEMADPSFKLEDAFARFRLGAPRHGLSRQSRYTRARRLLGPGRDPPQPRHSQDRRRRGHRHQATGEASRSPR